MVLIVNKAKCKLCLIECNCLNLVHPRKLMVGGLTIIALILTLGGFATASSGDRSPIWTEIRKIVTFLMGKCIVDPAINGVMLNVKNPV